MYSILFIVIYCTVYTVQYITENVTQYLPVLQFNEEFSSAERGELGENGTRERDKKGVQ